MVNIRKEYGNRVINNSFSLFKKIYLLKKKCKCVNIIIKIGSGVVYRNNKIK